MFCVLVGVVPPDENLADEIRQHVVVSTTIHDDDDNNNNDTPNASAATIEWRSSHSLAADPDNDDALTMLLTAFGQEPATAEGIVEQVAKFVRDNNNNNNEESCSSTVEMWASAPAPLPLRPLDGYDPHIEVIDAAVDEQIYNDNKHTWAHRAAVAMREWGLVVQPQVLSPKGVAEFQKVAMEAIQHVEQALAMHRPDIRIGLDSFCFQEIASRKQHRFDLRLLNNDTKDLVQ